jgi:hypothetical protein
MRRALASLLLTIFGFALTCPLLLSQAGGQVPACCRRDGKHHCEMMDPAPSAQSADTSLKSTCPVYSQARGLPHTPTLAFFVVPERANGMLFPTAPGAFSGGFIAVQRLAGAVRKRGPPSFFE